MISMCRETVHLVLCLMGDDDSIAEANKLFVKLQNGNQIPASIKKPVKNLKSLNCGLLTINYSTH